MINKLKIKKVYKQIITKVRQIRHNNQISKVSYIILTINLDEIGKIKIKAFNFIMVIDAYCEQSLAELDNYISVL